MSDSVATRIYHNTLAAERTVSADSMKVIGIVISNSSASAVDCEFTDAAGAAILAVTVAADDTFNLEVEFIVQGMIVAAESSAISVTVFYRPWA